MEQMGEEGARLLIEALEGRGAGGQKVVLPTQLVFRESGRYAPAAASL